MYRRLVICRSVGLVVQGIGLLLFLNLHMYLTALWAGVCFIWTAVDLLRACLRRISSPYETIKEDFAWLPLTGRSLNRLYFTVWFLLAALVWMLGSQGRDVSLYETLEFLGALLSTIAAMALEKWEVSILIIEKPRK